METETNQGKTQGKVSETKIVAVVFRQDGSAQVKHFERKDDLPESFELNGTQELSNKMFKTIPKRLAFLLEKGSFPKTSDDGKSSDDSKSSDETKAEGE